MGFLFVTTFEADMFPCVNKRHVRKVDFSFFPLRPIPFRNLHCFELVSILTKNVKRLKA